ncbi:MAG: 50S ribosomal protein L21 [Pirellulales bacterium]|nr:50S ribosomal protein L21 [Pirellulales bacterium]
MYAIIQDGGRQLKVEPGQEVVVDYRDVPKGEKITFDVVAIRDDAGIKLGKPTLSGASVTAEVLGVEMGPKLVVQRLRKRKNSRRRTGHRQIHTTVKIDAING